MKNKIFKIKMLIMDVDGVMTDGQIVIDSDGREIKRFDVQDGYGLVIARRAGVKTAIISARASRAVEIRGKDLKVNKIFQNAFPKAEAYQEILQEFRLKDEEVCFVGDDLADLQLMKKVGFAVAVENAVPEIKKAADYTTRRRGGAGAIREVVELILKTQGKWVKVVEGYS